MAILKIINSRGKYHDDESYDNLINYILNPIKTKSKYFGSCAIANCHDAAMEMKIFSRAAHKNHGVKLRHLIIGFDRRKVPASQPELALELAKDMAAYYGEEYQIIFAVHVKPDSLHVHFVMNAVNYISGLKHKGKKDDLYAFIKHCNGVLRRRGIADHIEREP